MVMAADAAAALLLEGARYGDEEDVVSALKQGGVEVANTSDDFGRTALHMAAANGHVGIVRHLLDNNADVKVVNDSKNTPLHWACLNGHEKVVELLLEAGAEATALNGVERTPVDEALDRGFDAIVKIIAKTLGDEGEGTKEGEAAEEEDPEEGVDIEEIPLNNPK